MRHRIFQKNSFLSPRASTGSNVRRLGASWHSESSSTHTILAGPLGRAQRSATFNDPTRLPLSSCYFNSFSRAGSTRSGQKSCRLGYKSTNGARCLPIQRLFSRTVATTSPSGTQSSCPSSMLRLSRRSYALPRATSCTGK